MLVIQMNVFSVFISPVMFLDVIRQTTDDMHALFFIVYNFLAHFWSSLCTIWLQLCQFRHSVGSMSGKQVVKYSKSVEIPWCKGKYTYTKNSHKRLDPLRSFLVFLPMLEHRNMVSDCNVAFSCPLCSKNRYRWPYLPFSYDNRQFATLSSGQSFETMSHIDSPIPIPLALLVPFHHLHWPWGCCVHAGKMYLKYAACKNAFINKS